MYIIFTIRFLFAVVYIISTIRFLFAVTRNFDNYI